MIKHCIGPPGKRRAFLLWKTFSERTKNTIIFQDPGGEVQHRPET